VRAAVAARTTIDSGVFGGARERERELAGALLIGSGNDPDQLIARTERSALASSHAVDNAMELAVGRHPDHTDDICIRPA
jgi:hypothetical protein